MFPTHPLDLPEIRSRITSSLGIKDLASCARVSQEWNDSFTPPLYNSVVLSKHGLSMESVERNKHFIQHLTINSYAYENQPSTSEQGQVVSRIMANSYLTTLALQYNSIGDNGAIALSEALKTNSTLITLELRDNSIGDNGAIALSDALKANSTLTILNLKKKFDRTQRITDDV
ncbi:hypothetical protein F5H01DRAFT_125986 [Linnemannia elongata]|nr:hypothetical protein F5H01DRAFT_125986 [Linnemannia elongata]